MKDTNPTTTMKFGWFLLHFNYHSAHLHRRELLKKVREEIPVYEKTRPIYEEYLKDKTSAAINNSKRLCGQYDDEELARISACQPYTNVHDLVFRMLRLAKSEKEGKI